MQARVFEQVPGVVIVGFLFVFDRVSLYILAGLELTM